MIAAFTETAQAFPVLPALLPPAAIAPLGTIAYLLENSRLGSTTYDSTWQPGFVIANSQNALGLHADVRQTHVRSHCTGKERDAETGLDYFGARYFSGAQARFTSPDPLLNSGHPENPQSWNRYAYVSNNPLKFIDPAGLWEWDASLGGSYSDDDLKKHYSKTDAKNILALRKDVRSAISRLDKSKDSTLQNAGLAYGTEGKANGVTIAMGPVSPGAAAQAEGDQGDMTVRVPGGRTGDSLFIDLAHEGTHVFNSQQVDSSVMFPEGGVLSFTRYDTEMNGYLASSAASRSIGGQGTYGATVNGTRYVLWDPAWTKVDLQTQPQQNIDKLLHASPLYNNPTGNPPKRLDDVVYGRQ